MRKSTLVGLLFLLVMLWTSWADGAQGWKVFLYYNTMAAGDTSTVQIEDQITGDAFVMNSWSYYSSGPFYIAVEAYVNNAWVWSDTTLVAGQFVFGPWQVPVRAIFVRATGAMWIQVAGEGYSSR